MNFSLLIPELTLFAGLVLLLAREIIIGTPKSGSPTRTLWFTASGVVVLALGTLFAFSGKTASSFAGSFLLDPLALCFKILFAGIVLVLIFMGREFFKEKLENSSEFLLILLCSLLALFFLASANDFVLMFVALETFTLSLYVMAAYMKKDLLSIESGLKYLIMGSLASAFVIYGISLLFTASGSTSFAMLRETFSLNPQNPLIVIGILFVIAGFGFKIASVPFQFWVPDVYEGAPTPVAAYLSTASKSAGVLLLLRFLFTAVPDFEVKRTVLFSALAVMTLLYGNLAALVQTNVKRLLGYSSISHAGYLLLGLAAGSQTGVSAILYYLPAYILSNLAAFQIITLVEKQTGSSQIQAYQGLGKKSPFLAGMFFLALLSLAGVPPLAGFFGKFLILFSAVKSSLDGLALLGALLVAVSLYYYLNLVRVMYFAAPEKETPLRIPVSSKILLSILAAGMLLLGIYQAPFLAAAEAAAKSLF